MNNFKTIYAIAFLVATTMFLSSCHKDKAQPDLGSGPITLHFDSQAGSDEFAFGTNYVTANGDTVNFSKFNFFVSNVVFVKTDGSTYTPPKDSTYRLVVESLEESHDLTINNVPSGDYTGVKFVIGVDSLKSVSDISQRTGDLDPAGAASDMYWTWNSGYIFYKVEGTSPQAPYDPMMMGKMFFYHIGGFGGYTTADVNNLRNVSLTYAGEAAHAGKGKAPEIHIYADALQLWKSPTPFTIAAHPGIMVDPFSSTVADNYKGMFTIGHIHND